MKFKDIPAGTIFCNYDRKPGVFVKTDDGEAVPIFEWTQCILQFSANHEVAYCGTYDVPRKMVDNV